MNTKSYIRLYIINFVLSVLFFGLLELILSQRHPLSEKPLETKIGLAIAVFIFIHILYVIFALFVPWYKKKVLKKVHDRLPGSSITGDFSLLIQPKEYHVSLTVDWSLLSKNKVEIQYKGNNTAAVNKAMKTRFQIKPDGKKKIFYTSFVGENEKTILPEMTKLLAFLESSR